MQMTPHAYTFDPLSLAQVGMAAWLTELMLAQKFAEALQMQGSLVMDASYPFGVGGRPHYATGSSGRPSTASSIRPT
jgi:hypothetical protein